MDKKSIRKLIIKERLELDKLEYLNKSNLIINKVKNNKYFIEAKTIGIYVSFNQEVETINLINEMLNLKCICVPKVDDQEMKFYQINSLDELSRSNFGILEPNNNMLIHKEQIDLLIVPIVAYDDDNNRIGYGGGYYDRYLSEYNGKTIGLAFELQRVEKINVESYDCKLDIIISEKN